jgi:hypothetical protein
MTCRPKYRTDTRQDFGSGCVVLVVVGVTPTRVLINNPWSGPEWISKSLFEPVYAMYENMAVILS